MYKSLGEIAKCWQKDDLSRPRNKIKIYPFTISLVLSLDMEYTVITFRIISINCVMAFRVK